MNAGLSIVLPLIIFAVIDLIIFCSSVENGHSTRGEYIFTLFVFFVMLSQGLTALAYACDLKMIAMNHGLQFAINLISLISMSIAAYLWFSYLYHTAPANMRRDSRLYLFVCIIPLAVLTITSAASPWTHWVFYIDESGMYQVGTYGFLQIIPYSYFIFAVLFSLDQHVRGVSIASIMRKFPLFAFPSMVGAFLNTLVIRGGYTQIGCSIGVVLMYLEQYMVEVNENRRLKSVEDLNTKLQKVNEEQKRNLDIVGTLSRAYLCVYYIDLRTGKFIEITRPSMSNVISHIGSTGYAKEKFIEMSKYLVAPEFEKEIRSFTDLSTLSARLQLRDIIGFQFKGATILGWCMGEFVVSRRDEEGRCTHVLWTIRSIQEQKTADEKNQQERMAQLNLINTLSQDYRNVYVIEPEKNIVRILKLNGYVTRGLSSEQKEYAYDETCRRYIEERVYADDVKMMTDVMDARNIVKELENSDQYAGTYRVVDKNEIHYYQFKYVRIVGTDSIIAGFQNVDRMIAAEREHQDELRKALLQAEQANASKTIFLNNMSHDIRTPLNAILGFSDLMETKKNDPQIISDYIKKIKTSGEYLLAIINSVLDMARIESGKETVDESFMDLLSEEGKTLASIDGLIKEKHHTFTMSNTIRHRYVLLDTAKHQQIMMNLIGNAVKYTPDYGRIHLQMDELPCGRPGYGTYRLTVSDNGIGMTQEFMEHIFDSFSRERNTTDSKVIGTGLGMSIVKKLVDLLGGTIEVRSELGKGSTFIVTFDHKIVDDPEEYIRKNKTEASDAANIAGKRILLAEDNDLNAEIAMAILEDFGALAERAEDGMICIDMLKKAEAGYYDLILMDIQMPNLNGYDAAKRIRALADEKKAHIPIIAMTANAFEEDKLNALNAGMNGHLTKPIEVDKMIQMLALTLK